MRAAYDAATVRAAEQPLLEAQPEGTLMARAAAGLATVCAQLLGGAYGARVLLLVGAGNNGGDVLHAGALLARRGARVEALLLADRVHEAGLDALRRAGGRVVVDKATATSATSIWCSTASSASAAAAGCAGARPRSRARSPTARWSWQPTSPAASTRPPARSPVLRCERT